MRKMSVSIEESQAERVEKRMKENPTLNRSEALRQELRASKRRSDTRKAIDVAASAVGIVGLLLVGFTYFMDDGIRAMALIPVIGSSVLYLIGYLIDAPGLPGVVYHE